MKVVQTKAATTASAASMAAATTAKTEAPFFAKGGEQDFFHSKTTEQPFFHKSTIASAGIQAKLSVGKPGDHYEREADSMADKVVQRLSEPAPDIQKTEEPLVNNVTPVVQLKCAECEQEEKQEEKIQEKEQDNKEEEQVMRKAIFESNEEAPPQPAEAQEDEEQVQRKAIFESNEEMPVQSKAIDCNAPAIQAKCAECEKEDEVEEQSAGKEEEEVQRKAIFESNEEMPVQSKAIDNAVPAVQAKCDECEKEEKEEVVQDEDAGKEKEEQLQRKPVVENNEEKQLQTKPEPSKEIKAEIKAPITPEPQPAVQKKAQRVAPASAPVTIQAEQNGEMEEEKKDDKESGEVLQKKPVFETNEQATPSIEQRLSTSKSGGQSLPQDARSDMESSFGADFSGVKVHTNSTAIQMSKEMGAQAFTHGSNIYFNEGKYDPSSKDGKHLLAHELTHTIQQGSSGTVQKSSQVPAIQKEGQDATLVKNDVNKEADAVYNNVNKSFNNGISIFQNWYFSKDEGDEIFFNEVHSIIKDSSAQVTNTSTLIGAKLAGAFTKGADSLVQKRTGFLTSLTKVVGGFSGEMRGQLMGKTAEIVEKSDSPGWTSVLQRHEARTDWKEILTNDGLPTGNLQRLQEHLLSKLIFAYNSWELKQHSAAYQGVYRMSDPNLNQMRAGAEAEAKKLVANPRINLGDIVFSLPDQELLSQKSTKPINNVVTIGKAGLAVPVYPGLGVGINGSLKAGYDVGASFGPIKLQKLQFGFSYSQSPIFFNLFSQLMLLNSLVGLKTLSSMYGTRFRASGELFIPAEAHAKLFVEAALGMGLEVGIPNIISANVAGIEGLLRASFGASINSDFRAPMDIIIDHGTMSFSHAMALNLGANVDFDVTGGIKAHFLTLDWEKTWKIAAWHWGKKWEFQNNMNLIYSDGMDPDPDNTINLQNVIHSVSELLDLGQQLMNANNNTTSGGAPQPAAVPNPSGHLDLTWPKPPSAAYPALYLTARGETRSQRELKTLFDAGDSRNIAKFTIHQKKTMPAGEAELGIDPEWQIAAGKNVGPLTTATTPGGEIINRLVRPYGVNPSEMNGDHVHEIQLGGENVLVNLWPLNASINKGSGSRLNSARVTEASTGHVFTISFLKTVIENNPGTNYFFIIRGFS